MRCGLCCDGTLFNHVDLTPEDDIIALASFGIQILSDTASPAFKQCCAAYKNGSCSIYAERPHACRSFRCALLKRFEANKISQAEALKIIREAVTLRDELKREMCVAFGNGDGTLDQFSAQLKDRWNNATSVEAKDRVSAVFRKFAALWLCINKHFQKQWQR